MNKNIIVIISLFVLIVLTLAIDVLFIKNTFEGMDAIPTNAQIYAQSQQQAAVDKGFSSGFAGSGSVNGDSQIPKAIDYKGLYGNTAPTEDAYNKLTKFNMNNYDVEYHDDVQTILDEEQGYGLTTKNITVKDMCGNTVIMPFPEIQGTTLYNEPGSYRFGPSSYVPSYEDSVYLSRTMIDLSANKQPSDKNIIANGFCDSLKDFPDKLEDQCRITPLNNCASTSCCVLFGGKKCVAGNQQGPYIRANYSDIFVKNKDFYYYQGKCYGNCNYRPREPIT
jgi:hypothetical protein